MNKWFVLAFFTSVLKNIRNITFHLETLLLGRNISAALPYFTFMQVHIHAREPSTASVMLMASEQLYFVK